MQTRCQEKDPPRHQFTDGVGNDLTDLGASRCGQSSIPLFFMIAMIIPVAVRKIRDMSITIDSIVHSNRCRVGNWAITPTRLYRNLMGV
jgi:hypothetical protein